MLEILLRRMDAAAGPVFQIAPHLLVHELDEVLLQSQEDAVVGRGGYGEVKREVGIGRILPPMGEVRLLGERGLHLGEIAGMVLSGGVRGADRLDRRPSHDQVKGAVFPDRGGSCAQHRSRRTTASCYVGAAADTYVEHTGVLQNPDGFAKRSPTHGQLVGKDTLGGQ